jgi:hypothetical protein
MLVGRYCEQVAAEIARYRSSRYQWTADSFSYGTPGLLEELAAVGDQCANGVLSEQLS